MGWPTIWCALVLLATIGVRTMVRGKSKSVRLSAALTFVVATGVFLFSFMQWASWYK